MRHNRFWALVACLFIIGHPTKSISQDLQVPNDYGIDLQLAVAGRSAMMNGGGEIVGTTSNETGDEVFHGLVSAGFAQPYPWKLTLVNSGVVNASSTAGGQIYVYGGMLPVIGQNKGLWAAVLSHETAHTGLRHQVNVYMRRVYIQQMIQYYRARASAGDNSANWALIGFVAASKISLTKMEREQEHQADQQGMFLMAKAGYHPDYVFALHHVLLMRSGEQSKFGAFFSDHPRWETRDQRDDKVYTDALGEFNRLWPDASISPGGRPPVVAFLGQPTAVENKATGTADISLPLYCRNADQLVDLVLVFNKGGHAVKAVSNEFADKDGNFVVHEKSICIDKSEATPTYIHVPAGAVAEKDRAMKAAAFVGASGELIAGSKQFDVRLPKLKKK
jgi:hypothetical protein